ncbi:MAG TPA: 16S rRNA (adenine(1518)-N(6)/adenine(1519)-N(6))-dimethyltransferase RsmA [Chromatiales bacterium]|nr:16S rRNA (adenine(1518)-N(6)/adenine(1519)-N(6))-dimethyltransferase RsmA [Chromatiales bacterium]
MAHQARKRFGQHFLHDNHVLENIVTAINPQAEDNMVEIGPGKGALTFPLAEHLNQLTVIELDRDLISQLEATGENLVIHNADALKFDFNSLADEPHSLRVAGNLPYNISTPLIFHLLEQVEIIKDMHFLLQKEVVNRLAATPGGKDFGRLSIMVQYFCKVEKLFTVSPGSFSPPPKVDSAVVRLTPWEELPAKAKNYSQFSRIVQQAFSQRRKTLRRSLKNLIDEKQFMDAGIGSGLRPEQISVADFVYLSNQS